MSQTPLTIKIDTDVKHQAQKLAKGLGLSLSSIIENKLKEVIRDRRVVFEEPFIPNARTAKLMSEIEEDIKHGRNLSGPTQSYEELEEALNSL